MYEKLKLHLKQWRRQDLVRGGGTKLRESYLPHTKMTQNYNNNINKV